MIFVNLLDDTPEHFRNPLDKARTIVLFAIPFFVALVVIAAWPNERATEIRQATQEEREAVIELLSRLPGYYGQLDKISASISDEIVFERAGLLVRKSENSIARLEESSMMITEGFLKSDPRTQAKALAKAIAPHQKQFLLSTPEIAVSHE